MRVVLFLTVGIPVFAAQLVAYALPRVEVTPFTLLRLDRNLDRNKAADVTARAEQDVKVQAAHPIPPSFAFTWPVDDGFVAADAPEGAAGRALLFVKHVRRQAS